MAGFDPDAYLGTAAPVEEKKKKQQGFNPDAYLAGPAATPTGPVAPPETALQTFGRSSASLADTALNAVTGTLDLGARALARGYYGGIKGMTGRELEDRITAETTSPKDVFGTLAGVKGTSGYENAPLRAAGRAIAPVIEENIIKPVAETAGVSPEYASDIIGIGSFAVAPAVPKVAGGVVNAGKTVGKTVAAVPEVAKGAYGLATGKTAKPGVEPEVWQQRSARQPAASTYHPAEDIAAWKSGEIPTAQVRSQPWTESQQRALERTQGNVPFQGQVNRAIGEQFIEPYTSWKGYVPDVALGAAGTMLGVGPFVGPALNMARRGVNAYRGIRQAGAMNQLGEVGFTPLFKEELAALNKGQPHPSVIMEPGQPGFDFRAASQAANKQAATAPVATAPVAPTPLLTYEPKIYVSPEGVAATDMAAASRAGLEQKYAPQTVAPGAPEVAPAPQAAPARLVSTEAALNAEKQAALNKMLEELRAKKTGETESSLGPAPRVEPVAPTDIPDVFKTETPTAPVAETPMLPVEKAARTDVRSTLKTSGKAGINSKNGIMVLDKKLYNDNLTALGYEVPDWSKLPNDYKSQSVADARKTVNNWVYEQVKDQIPKESRGPQMQTIIKQEQALKTPEQIAAEEAAVQARMEKWKRGGVRMPRDTMEMQTTTPTFKDATDFKNQQMMDKLSGKYTEGQYKQGDKLIVYTIEYVGPFEREVKTIYSTKTGEKIGTGEVTQMRKIK